MEHNTIVEFPDQTVIEDQALEWLIRLDGDDPLSAREEQALDQWLARSPAHREALRHLNIFWSNNQALTEMAEPASVVDHYRKRLLAYCWPLQTMTLATALSSVVLLALVLGLVFLRTDITATNGVYMTAVGQQKTITLADASVIELNTNSQIEVEYGENFRNIRLLQGEVHFEVAKDKRKPFRVYAGSGRVQAVGTAFNLYLKGQDLDVYVTEGRVAVASLLPVAKTASTSTADKATTAPQSSPAIASQYTPDPYAKTPVNNLGVFDAGDDVTLKKIQPTDTSTNALTDSPTYAQGASQALKAKVALIHNTETDKQNQRLAWRQGLLIFSGEPLAQVVKEISRYTSVTIEIVSPELRQLEVGGQIVVGNTDSIFKALEANFGLRVKQVSYNRVQLVADQG